MGAALAAHDAAAVASNGSREITDPYVMAEVAEMHARTRSYDVPPPHAYGVPQAVMDRRPSLRGGIGGTHPPPADGAAHSLQALIAMQGQPMTIPPGAPLTPADRQQYENAIAVARQQQHHHDMYTRHRHDSSSTHLASSVHSHHAHASTHLAPSAAHQGAVATEPSLYDRCGDASPRGSFSYYDLPRTYQAAVAEFHARFQSGDPRAVAAVRALRRGDDHLPKIESDARLALMSPTADSNYGTVAQFSGDSPPTVHPHGGGRLPVSAAPPSEHAQQYVVPRSASAPHAAVSPHVGASSPVFRSPSSQSQPPVSSFVSPSCQRTHHSSSTPASANDYSFEHHTTPFPVSSSATVNTAVSPRPRTDSSMSRDIDTDELMRRGTKRPVSNATARASTRANGNDQVPRARLSQTHARHARTAASIVPDEDTSSPHAEPMSDESKDPGASSSSSDSREHVVISGAVSDDALPNLPDTDLPRAMFRPTLRKKTNRACESCRKAKTRCDEARPCHRCIRLGKKDCVDRPLTKRHRSHPQRDPISFLSSFSQENLPGKNTVMDLPMLSNEEHAQSVSAEGLVVVRSLDWSNVHADVVSTLLPFMINGSCSDVDEQRRLIKSMATDYSASITLEADRMEGDSNSADPLFEYVPDYLVEDFPYPMLRDNLRVSSQLKALEMKFRFSRFLPEMLGYSHEELAQMQRNGQGRLYHHDDWADFLRRSFRRTKVNQNDLFSTSSMVRLRKRDGTYIRAIQVSHISLSMSSSSWASFMHMLTPIPC